MAKKPINLPENPPEDAAEQPAESPRARQTSQPFCPYHKDVRCKSRNSGAFFTRYYCPVDGCTFSVKLPRPEIGQRTREADEEEGFSAR